MRQPRSAPRDHVRFSAPLSATNICNKLTPGNAATSRLYDKDAARPPGIPVKIGAGMGMPPLATREPDARQLAITAAWINGMTTCP
jgi:hypothetical protein